ncbi:MAG: ParB/RepB/Spo0J family partition protein [bacterium]|nr:ParB/RepB/Spo0J family partition protein [bacterium]
MSKKALGKGLGALITNVDYDTRGEILEIPIERIFPNPAQPRKYFDEEKLAGLASSIKEKGIIQPIFVRKSGDGYIIVAGERRWRAAQKAGLTRIPVIVKELTEQEELELALIENLQREDLNSIEEGESYQRLIEVFNYTQERLASILGKDKSTVSNTLRLLKLEEPIKDYIRLGLLSMGHARALLSVPNPQDRLALSKKIVQRELSVRQVESLVKRYGASPKRVKEEDESRLFLRALEDELKALFGTYVRIKDRKGRGKIEIAYSSTQELERIIDLMKAIQPT